ncbi:MAG: lipid asymmetry maintenance ABC transporter permease subunit MlaE [Wenzhouxiangellaceae bacterium]
MNIEPPAQPKFSGHWSAPLRHLGQAGLFLVRIVMRIRLEARQWAQIMRQIYFIGLRSLVIIMTGGLFVGLVLALQTYDVLSDFGAVEAIGTVVGKSLYRELGPVLAALLFAGRAGTAVTAEIGLMKATEQLDALDLMAIDPIERIVLPRLLAATISLPVLTLLFDMLAILGGYFYSVTWMGMDSGIYWGNMQNNVSLNKDFIPGLYKSVVFGLVCGLTAVYYGYYARPTGEGVGIATTQTVIVSSILVLVLDFALSALML